ncbi:hypothetical protein Golax_024961, partial [Gossypium laxum]|nr:hypothetical protein [Gossypium laxum]
MAVLPPITMVTLEAILRINIEDIVQTKVNNMDQIQRQQWIIEVMKNNNKNNNNNNNPQTHMAFGGNEMMFQFGLNWSRRRESGDVVGSWSIRRNMPRKGCPGPVSQNKVTMDREQVGEGDGLESTWGKRSKTFFLIVDRGIYSKIAVADWGRLSMQILARCLFCVIFDNLRTFLGYYCCASFEFWHGICTINDMTDSEHGILYTRHAAWGWDLVLEEECRVGQEMECTVGQEMECTVGQEIECRV